jgi:hypothetical protein
VWDENSVSTILILLSSPHIIGSLMFPVSCHTEQLRLCSQQHIVVTVEDSVLRTEMVGLESQEEDSPNRILFFESMS